jgi:hypothetical protein
MSNCVKCGAPTQWIVGPGGTPIACDEGIGFFRLNVVGDLSGAWFVNMRGVFMRGSRILYPTDGVVGGYTPHTPNCPARHEQP